MSDMLRQQQRCGRPRQGRNPRPGKRAQQAQPDPLQSNRTQDNMNRVSDMGKPQVSLQTKHKYARYNDISSWFRNAPPACVTRCCRHMHSPLWHKAKTPEPKHHVPCASTSTRAVTVSPVDVVMLQLPLSTLNAAAKST
jgi:hypothetical protein